VPPPPPFDCKALHRPALRITHPPQLRCAYRALLTLIVPWFVLFHHFVLQERLMSTALRLDQLVNLIPPQYYIGKSVEEELDFVREQHRTLRVTVPRPSHAFHPSPCTPPASFKKGALLFSGVPSPSAHSHGGAF
jgi:hypothetical protein